MKRKHHCVVCGRREGDKVDQGGSYDGVPLGEVTRCQQCGQWACPDCEHERDCCEKLLTSIEAAMLLAQGEG